MTQQQEQKYASLARLLQRPSPFGNETGQLPNGEFEPSAQDNLNKLSSSKVLVVGAGGLGCEVLKDLALSGFRDIDVIDMDTIDVTNLNRQFLFRMADVGKFKAQVAAEFVMNRVPSCKVTHHTCKIQEKGPDFYRQFKIIISGLDNIEARRWLNSTLVGMVEFQHDEIVPESIIPMIDGGTEGFKGQARVILPRITSCFECSISTFAANTGFAICTVASTPRLPEHCIAYAMMIAWDRERMGQAINKDSPEDMKWLYEKALARANEFNIKGVTYFLTMGVVKNIIPAVASTNAIVSAACVSEAFKFITFASQSLNTWFMYMGNNGMFTDTFPYEKQDECVVCGDASKTRVRTVPRDATVQGFLDSLVDDKALQLKQPDATAVRGQESVTLYMRRPAALETALRPNLDKLLSDFLESGDEVTVSDATLNGVAITFRVLFAEAG
jgi:ubiquitin-activating enzyme E1 C